MGLAGERARARFIAAGDDQQAGLAESLAECARQRTAEAIERQMAAAHASNSIAMMTASASACLGS